jgi:hypothetical protein
VRAAYKIEQLALARHLVSLQELGLLKIVLAAERKMAGHQFAVYYVTLQTWLCAPNGPIAIRLVHILTFPSQARALTYVSSDNLHKKHLTMAYPLPCYERVFHAKGLNWGAYTVVIESTFCSSCRFCPTKALASRSSLLILRVQLLYYTLNRIHYM